jgi:hypothetical protein
MPDIYPPREKLIELLVDDDINGFYDRDDQADYISYLMIHGFVGYNNQTDQEIIDECIDRNFFEEEENKNA